MITHNFIKSNLETIVNLENTVLKSVRIKIRDLDTGDLKKEDLCFEIQRIHTPIEGTDAFNNFELFCSVNDKPRVKEGEFTTLALTCDKLLDILKKTNFIKWKTFSLEVS